MSAEKMTAAEVRKRVEAIRAIQADDEAAHSAEDALHHDVLAAIAAGRRNARALASEALKTSDISFARWCA